MPFLYLYTTICAPHRQGLLCAFRIRKRLCVTDVDTQSRFAVNTARSIVCVGTRWKKWYQQEAEAFQCRTQHCVCRDGVRKAASSRATSFNAARSIVCVGTNYHDDNNEGSNVSMPHAALCVSGRDAYRGCVVDITFQCRTRHYVCRDKYPTLFDAVYIKFQCRTRHYVCRDKRNHIRRRLIDKVSMPHAALCVSGP